MTVETSGERSHGVVAQGARVTLSAGDILVRGLSAHGLYASGLGELTFRGGQVVVEGSNANAVRATGQGGIESFAIVSEATLLSRAAGSTVVLADAGGFVQLTDSRVVHDVPGGGIGLGVVAQVGSQASLLNVDIDMRGTDSVGLGAGGRVDMAGGSIRALGAGSRAVDLAGGQTTLRDVQIEAYSGIILRDGARLNLTGGSVSADQIALDVNGLSTSATVQGAAFSSLNQTAVRMFQDSILSMQDSTVATQADSAVGMDLRAGTATLDNVQIDSAGDSSHGLYVDVRISGFNTVVTANDLVIRTRGADAAGVVVRGGATVTMTNSQVLTQGAGATGVLSRGRLALTNTDVRTEGADAWAARIEDNGRLTMDGGSLASTQGGGLWLRSSRDSELVLANGARLAGGNGIALALDAAVAGPFNVRLQDGAQMEGDVALHPDDVAAGLLPQSQVQVALSDASLWTGGTVLAEDVTLDGASQWVLRGASTIDSLGVSDSSLLLSGDGAGGMSTLTITGDLDSSNATFQFSGALGGDDSALGHIHVQGDTQGDAGIRVVNAGGAGAATTDGIELIAVDGASLATYTLVGRAVAGLHEYFLHKGGVTGGEGNWYLRSVASDPCEVDPDAPGCKPVDPGPGPDPDPDPEPEPEPEPEPVLRPEPGGAYLANQVAALGMFQHRLHDRVGEPVFAQGRNAWVRVVRQQPQFTTLGGQLSVRGGTSVVQLGGDLLHTDGWNLGVMLGAGYGSHDVTSDLTEYQAKARLRGTAAGVYSTWRQNPVQGDGLYLDASIQFARFDNRVQSDGLARETYDSRATLGSLEAGYTVPVWKGAGSTLYLQPQVQLEHVHYRADRHVEATGTVVDNDQSGGWEGRAGLRLFGRGNQGSAVVQPFVALNWMRGPRTNSLDFNGETLGADVPRNRYEVQAGAELQLGTRWAAWGSASVQRGDDDYRRVAGQLGVRMAW